MKTNFNKVTTFFILSLFIVTNTHSETVIFSDSFESGDFSKTDTDGFGWANPNGTDIVSQAIAGGKDWRAKTGDYSMRFRYAAYDGNRNKNANVWSEQRFNIGKSYKDLWVKYWLRVPTNYEHERNVSGWASNNKLFAIWMDRYSSNGDGASVVWQMWRKNSNETTLALGFSGGKCSGDAGKQLDFMPFITVPGDRGRWMQVIFHVKAATNRSSNDGVIEMWRRWQDESKFEKLHDIKGANMGPPNSATAFKCGREENWPKPIPSTPSGWQRGYLMGWSNSAYKQATDWLLDDFMVSDTRFTELDSSVPVPVEPISPVLPIKAPPNPPENVEAN